jgi:putative pyruvate formate lyase activating enzyme
MGAAQGGGAGAAVSVGRPSYLDTAERGELAERLKRAEELLASCVLCPRRCGVNRMAGELGYCRAGAEPVVASWNVHIWEEPPISGTRGSGTIFFSHCTARCLFCQNYPISQLGVGDAVPVERLAEMTLELQAKGCHNINFVTPTHFATQIVLALPRAIELGLSIPLVYNTSGYDSLETLQMLDGIVDVYLPDAKYASDATARRLSGFKGYVEADRAALKEIFRQVGEELVLGDEDIAERGMIIRHMVLPGGLAQSEEVFRWIARELSPNVHISVMNQYFPAYRALDDPVLGRKVSPDEYLEAMEAFERAGLQNGWFQEQDEECE